MDIWTAYGYNLPLIAGILYTKILRRCNELYFVTCGVYLLLKS